MFNLLPKSMTPPPRTRQDIMRDIELQKKQAPILAVMLPLYIGFFFCFIAVALFLK